MARHSIASCGWRAGACWSLSCALVLLARLGTATETDSQPATTRPQIPPLASIEHAADGALAAKSVSERKYQNKELRALEVYRGHPFNQPLSEFIGKLESRPIGASVVYSHGKVTEFDLQCVPRGDNSCDLSASLMHQEVEGEGFHVMAEYVPTGSPYVFISSMSDPLSESRMFCMNWLGEGAKPGTLLSELKFCGVRLSFRTHNEAELTAVDDDVLTNYERVLDFLRADLGDPKGYSPNTRVIIRTPNEVIKPPRKRRFRDWYWCPVSGDKLAPSCKSSAVLHVDLKTGAGVVLLGVRPLYEFAYAQHESNADDTSLYQLLFRDKFPGTSFSWMNSISGVRPYQAKPLPPKAMKLFWLPPKWLLCDFCDEGREAWLETAPGSRPLHWNTDESTRLRVLQPLPRTIRVVSMDPQ